MNGVASSVARIGGRFNGDGGSLRPWAVSEYISYSLPVTKLLLAPAMRIQDSGTAMVDRHRHTAIHDLDASGVLDRISEPTSRLIECRCDAAPRSLSKTDYNLRSHDLDQWSEKCSPAIREPFLLDVALQTTIRLEAKNRIRQEHLPIASAVMRRANVNANGPK